MNELRFVRREERSLILANESDDEFRLVIDDLLVSELKHASRKEREGTRVRPREIQALVRAGKSRSEIASITGLEEADIERYEEPVLAERRYILERAHAVQVRTEASDEDNQTFGAVIAERLIALEADASEWAAWRDEETGWLVSLEFISHDVAHRALWSFDHRKQVLATINSDAVNLSKQGDVGDRLIPKLRAVDNGERTSQFAVVEPAATPEPAATAEQPQSPAAPADAAATAADVAPDAATGPEPVAPDTVVVNPVDVNAEYARRREIDQRAIKSDDSGPVDFSQTADLLDALRRRRGERQQAESDASAEAPATPLLSVAEPAELSDATKPVQVSPAEDPAPRKPRSIWGGAGVASGVTATPPRDSRSGTPAPAPSGASPAPAPSVQAAPAQPVPDAKPDDARPAKKGRASIPSWDDILFGTRSDEDPAE